MKITRRIASAINKHNEKITNFCFQRLKTSSFKSRLLTLIKSAIPYSYPENKGAEIPDFKESVLVCANPLINFFEYLKAKRSFQKLDLKSLEWTYANLEDEYSKEIMLYVIVYNLFNKVKLRFPLYYSKYFDELGSYAKLAIDDKEISVWFNNIKLKKYDLTPLGYDVILWFSPGGLLIEFVLEQYRYKNIVTAEENDNVIDGGACYGDTALYFAKKTKGKVFSFEFMKENLEIFRKNMELNPKYKDQIELVERPLGLKSNEKLYAVFNGPGTSISNRELPKSEVFETISIDDYVKENNIKKIDFIKLDVEGSEESILKGAVETIRKFKPKLAICAYHKKDDLIVLPRLIKSILPEYKLYLNHNTIMSNETVIYAKV